MIDCLLDLMIDLLFRFLEVCNIEITDNLLIAKLRITLVQKYGCVDTCLLLMAIGTDSQNE